MNKTTLNVFSGETSLLDFLNPDNSPPLPMVELPGHCNPFKKDGVRIFAKLMNMLPLANVKSLPAYNMLLEARESGKLDGTHSLIENSSGNTVFSLATMGRIFGINNTKAIVSHEVTWGKLQLLRLFGTGIVINQEPICPDPNDTESGIHKAKKIGGKKGWFNPGQYDNEANPRAHEKWTAPQIWKQTEGKITVFCAGLGTTGTLVGAGQYLKNKNVTILGVARSPNNPVPGVRTPNLLREIAFDWKNVADHIEEAGTKESFKHSLDLCRAGLMVGPSAGFALSGLLKFLGKQKESYGLDRLRNKDGEVLAVFICPDSPLPYLNEYFEYLDESDFPTIENEELLINRPDQIQPRQNPAIADNFELRPQEVAVMIYSESAKKVWGKANNHETVKLKKGIRVIDLRSKMEFEHFHIPGSEQMDLHKPDDLQALADALPGHKIILVCPFGNRTKAVAMVLRQRGVEAYSMTGGMTEWSRLNLPRWRPEICQV